MQNIPRNIYTKFGSYWSSRFWEELLVNDEDDNERRRTPTDDNSSCGLLPDEPKSTLLRVIKGIKILAEIKRM